MSGARESPPAKPSDLSVDLTIGRKDTGGFFAPGQNSFSYWRVELSLQEGGTQDGARSLHRGRCRGSEVTPEMLTRCGHDAGIAGECVNPEVPQECDLRCCDGGGGCRVPDRASGVTRCSRSRDRAHRKGRWERPRPLLPRLQSFAGSSLARLTLGGTEIRAARNRDTQVLKNRRETRPCVAGLALLFEEGPFLCSNDLLLRIGCVTG